MSEAGYRFVQVKVPEEDLAWFEINFSMATKQGFVADCFRYLRLAVESGVLPTPNAYSAKAAMNAAGAQLHKQSENS